MLTIIVYGTPGPQGSKRFMGRAGNGRGILIENSPKAKIWREAVKASAIDVLSQVASRPALIGPVCVRMVFTLPKPAGAPKRRRTWPDRKPDLSKLVRATEDALTDAGVWEDDARVILCIAQKVYPGEEDGALQIPGALIQISPDRHVSLFYSDTLQVGA